MMIRFKCKTCGKKYQIAEKHAGKTTRCSKCNDPITVPESTPPAPEESLRTTPPPAPIEPVAPSKTLPPLPTLAANMHVNFDQKTPSGLQGFFRAFGITSGFMAAVVAGIIGLPILVCGGCLASIIGIGATAELPTRITSESLRNNIDSNPPASEPATANNESSTESLSDIPDSALTEQVVIQTLPTVDLAGNPNIFIFNDLVVTVKDKYINDVRIINLNGRPVTVDVLLENSSGKTWRPRVKLEFINAYGVVLGSDSISWAFDSMEPNKRHTESIKYYAHRFDEVFKYSTISKPPDFDTPKYLLISYL